MELHDVLVRRRMVRAFLPHPVDPDALTGLLDDALRSPTAGNTGGVSWLVLEGLRTGLYWEHTTTEPWRLTARRWPGLAAAPVVALSLYSERAYRQRYAQEDKQEWGMGTHAWPVPYWVGDAAFSVMALLLGATDAGLAACFLGNFRGESSLRSALRVPDGWRIFGAVLLGHPAAEDPRSGSLDRPVPPRTERIHRGSWGRH